MQDSHRCAVILAVLMAAVSSAAAPPDKFANVDEQRLASASREPGQWFTNGRDGNSSYYSPLKLIDDRNVVDLGFAWEFRTGTSRGMEATPIVVDGVMYTTGVWGVVYALNAATGELLWKFDPHVPGQFGRQTCCDIVNRGVAVWKGKVYVASTDARLFALDALTGARVWEANTLEGEHGEYSSTGVPQVAGNVVVIGNSGGDMNSGGVRGFITAYTLDTGQKAWRFYTVPSAHDSKPSAALRRAARTWDPAISPAFGRGGTVWSFMAHDSELQLLYFGTGNPAPYTPHNRSPSGGHFDGLYTDCIVAVHAKSGRLAWYFQTTPDDAWDYDAAAPLVLADLKIRNESRKVLMQANKNGYFYVLDRVSGKPISARPFIRNINWTSGLDANFRPVASSEGDYERQPRMIFPSGAGGHQWMPMAFSPITRLVYIPVIDLPVMMVDLTHKADASLHEQDYSDPELGMAVLDLSWSKADQEAFFGKLPDFPSRDPKTSKAWSRGGIEAWDPVEQKLVWRQETAEGYFVLDGGTLSTGGNLVFAGRDDGQFVAYAADTGRILKILQTGSAVMAAPMTYELDGVQYVAVMAGRGGSALPNVAYANSAVAKYANENRIIALRLGGPEVPKPALAPSEPFRQPPPSSASADAIRQGKLLFAANCSRCHPFGRSITVDLRRLMDGTGDIDVFKAIVLKGAYASKGMGQFDDRLSEDNAQAIHDYLIDEARSAYEEQQRTAESGKVHQ